MFRNAFKEHEAKMVQSLDLISKSHGGAKKKQMNDAVEATEQIRKWVRSYTRSNFVLDSTHENPC
jgi:hypothetical protein